MNAFQPFDYNAAVGAGTQNAFNALQFENTVQQMQDTAQKRQLQAKAIELSGKAITGNNDALTQLATISPDAAKGVQDFLKTASDEQRQKKQYTQQQLGRTAEASTTPEQWDANMLQASKDLGDPQIAQLVGHFDKRNQLITMAGLTAQALYGPVTQVPGAPKGTVGQQDDSSKEWKVVSRPEKPTKGSPEDLAQKTAISNQIYGRTVALFGGFYDPQTNTISGLDKTSTQRVAGLSAFAEKLFYDNHTKGDSTMTIGQAVAEAGRRANPSIDIPDYTGSQAPAAPATANNAGGGSALPSAGAPPIPTIKSDADYAALPSGSVFIAPDGTRRRKP